jgi:type 1 glutamine amidotransferase
MHETPARQALIVRGGWEGHGPVEGTKRFIPFLVEHGFDVEISETLDVYLDAERMRAVDLVLQIWTMGEMSEAHTEGLAAAVRAGTGLAGWHGGIVDAFRSSPEYLQLTGGQFATHPGGFRTHRVDVVAERADHPIVEGLSTWELYTEQYWILTDAYNDVLATTCFSPEPDGPWDKDVVMPAVWTRQWGKGRVFVSTIGHNLDDLDLPPVRTLTERGLLWASR